ncbi:hypothetical protein ACJMK2_038967 [Sinanodonta woodiana]|uniref:Uncharacterized protein n=1 Tax=Sinanodonta woodiana TaxID=1069815 RepID=A0ABD3WAK9_SINWO
MPLRRRWIILLLEEIFVLALSLETEAVCLRSSLPINDGIITKCADVNGNKVSSTQDLLSSGVVCMVTQPKCQNRSTLIECTDSGWFSENKISDAECKSELLTSQVETEKKLLRKRRGWFRVRIRVRLPRICIWSCSSPPPKRDTSPPTLKCPGDITKYSDPLQTRTSVSWPEPEAYDNVDGKISPSKGGPSPGSMFSEGTTTITYHAKDKSGNWAKCSFKIIIKVIRCPKIRGIADGFFLCQPLTDYLNGTTCRFGCYKGHYLTGPETIQCLASGQWSSQTPICEKTLCNTLIPRSSIEQISCSDQNRYRSKCTYTCKSGYDIAPGKTRVRVCTEYQSWNGDEPVCEDTEPPTIKNCPDTVVGYTDVYKTTGRLFWSEPYSVDNSGYSLLQQISGPRPDTTIKVGVYTVNYLALDMRNNSRKCSFKVAMKQISCFALQPKPYSWVSCPNGTIEGSTCVFSCVDGTTLKGQDIFTCLKNGEEYKYGTWSIKEQPYCVSTAKCPTINAPDNGAVACDNWLKGSVCQMQCVKGYDLPSGANSNDYNQLIICGDSGAWNLNPTFSLPNCAKVIAGRQFTLEMKVGFYYDGPCQQYMQQIRSNFIGVLRTDPVFSSLCAGSPKCTYDNVKVVCGKSTQKKRSAEPMIVEFDTQFEQTDSSSNLKDMLLDMEDKKNDMLHKIMSGNVSLTIDNTVIAPAYASGGDLVPTCEPGSEPSSGSLQCVECNPGYYYDNETHKCTQCPKGTFQNESGQMLCIQCMPNQTTIDTGSTVCIDACPPGSWSKTGAEQEVCSPCPTGTYFEGYGATVCKRCPASETTLSEGSVNMDSCKEFDIEFPASDINSSATLVYNLTGPISNVYIGIWIRCQNCGNSSLMEIVSMEDDEILLKVHVTNVLTVNIKGYLHESYTTSSLLDGRWHHLLLNVSNGLLSMCLDVTACSFFTKTIPENWLPPYIKLQLGGAGFSGSVSQVNIWSSEKYIASDKRCFNTYVADILSWYEFATANLTGSILQIPSECDDTNACLSSPCRFGACTDMLDGYTCSCDLGYSGSNCDINIDDCTDNACQHNSSCIDSNNSYTCACPSPYTGTFCEIATVDGNWSIWAPWSDCSVTCSNGTQVRLRSCTNPSPDNGGDECEGNESEVVICVKPVCKVCSEPSPLLNGDLNTVWDGETVHIYPRCHDDYDFDIAPLDDYICGPDTDHEWNFENEDNPYKRLPSCVLKTVAKKNQMKHSYSYRNLSCADQDIALKAMHTVTEITTQSVNSIGCVENSKCILESVDINNCDASNRERREIRTLQVTVILSCDPNIVGIALCVEGLLESVEYIQTLIQSGMLDSVIDNSTYIVDANSSSISGSSECNIGETAVESYCLPCGIGTYESNGFCTACHRGTYQDHIKQTSCRNCPDGWTTKGQGATDSSFCNVALSRADSEIKYLFILGLTLGCVAGVIIIALAVVFWYKKGKIIFQNSCLKNKINPKVNQNKKVDQIWWNTSPYDTKWKPTYHQHA